MSYDEDPIEEILSRLRGEGTAAVLGGRQSAVDAITTVLKLVDRDTKILKQCREGLMKAREVAKVANVDQLEQVLEAVKVIVTTLRGRS